jgi:hypothetical protein
VSPSLTTVVVLVTVPHVAAFVVMIMIRLRRDEADGTTAERAKIKQCAVCRQPATHLGYDGLDPNERRDPYTCRSYSTDLTRYQPLCASH